MILLSKNGWEMAGGVASLAVVGGITAWLLLRKRSTDEEQETLRRKLLVQSGRLVDGMLLDINEIPAEDGHTAAYLLFSYRIGGVDYECSQDITTLISDKSQIRIGFPCTVRYQPGNPQNSIVVAENWTGLRARLPQYRHSGDHEPIDSSHLRRKA